MTPLENIMARALAEAVDEASRDICTHEETHRGGAVWNICNACGTCWPDGEKPIAAQPDWYADAVQVLAQYASQQDQEQPKATY